MKENQQTILKDLTQFQREHYAWAYIEIDSGKLSCSTIDYTIEDDEEGETMSVCSYSGSNREMESYLKKMDAASNELTLATYMWANHQALCDIYCYGEESSSAEACCGLLSAIKYQLYAIRNLSEEYYQDSLGFSQDYENDFKDCDFVNQEVKDAYEELEAIAQDL